MNNFGNDHGLVKRKSSRHVAQLLTFNRPLWAEEITMSKFAVGAPCAILVSLCLVSPSQAQNAEALKKMLNDSQLCKPLKFDAVDVFKLFGLNIPKTPLDTHIGWDNENHDVKTFTINGDHKLHSDLTIGCQPSDDGAILKLVGKKGSDVRLTEDATCEGTVGDGGAVPDLKCTTNGAGAQFLNKIADLDGQLKPIFQKAITAQ